MKCHACGHEDAAPFAFCPNCGTRPLPAAAQDTGGDAGGQWAADPRIAGDHKSTMAMSAVSEPIGGIAEPEVPKAGAGNMATILIGVAVIAGLGVAIYFLASF